MNGSIEHHDPGEPSTNSCPLLPGQTVNVLDVPIQSRQLDGDDENDSSNPANSTVFTLDPRDKYLPVRRAATTSAIQSHKARLVTASGSIQGAKSTASEEADVKIQTSGSTRTGDILKRPPSLSSIFQSMRLAKSADSNTKSGLAWPRKLFSKAGSSAGQKVAGDTYKKLHLPVGRSSTDDPALPAQRHSTARCAEESHSVAANQNACLAHQYSSQSAKSALPKEEGHGGHEVDRALSAPSVLEVSHSSGHIIPLNMLKGQTSFFAKSVGAASSAEHTTSAFPTLDDEIAQRNRIPMIQDNQASVPDGSFSEEANMHEHNFYRTAYSYTDSVAFSYTASDNFSPYYASNTTNSGPMSPCHLSTPAMSECADDFLTMRRDSELLDQSVLGADLDLGQHFDQPPSEAPPQPPICDPKTVQSRLGGFQGYCLPQTEQASALTIRKLPSAVFKPSNEGQPERPTSRQDLVNFWDDGSEHRVSSFEDVMDDLGYLGKLII